MSDLPRGIYGIADSGFRAELPMFLKLTSFLEGGVRVIQLRAKGEPSGRFLEMLREARPVCREAGCTLIANDRPDLASIAEVDGVHLGEHDLPVAEARRIMGPNKLIGATVRTLEEACAAAAAGADYVGFGPVFGTTTKRVSVAPRGTGLLAEVVRDSPIPVVAIGGIDLARVPDVARAGAAGAAVVSAVLGAEDRVAAARALVACFTAESRR